jgi:hypothetical protein
VHPIWPRFLAPPERRENLRSNTELVVLIFAQGPVQRRTRSQTYNTQHPVPHGKAVGETAWPGGDLSVLMADLHSRPSHARHTDIDYFP